MPKVQSINQNPSADALPNFRNVGATLRILLLVNLFAMLLVLARAQSWSNAVQQLAGVASYVEPVLLTILLLLYALNPVLKRFVYWQGAVLVLLLSAAVAGVIYQIGLALYILPVDRGAFYASRNALLSGAGAALLLAYFRLRAHALSPAVHNARLQALQARIRPHFLFNTINAVLSIVRADPKRAETALENMSDLFRMAMADVHDLVLLRREVELSRQYLALEQLRLGERLNINWHVDNAVDDALVPPLMLQPLLENAVYHGIEPLEQGGAIDITLHRKGNELHLEVRNPNAPQGRHHQGNKMALENIRERLALQFDVEAHYAVESSGDFYHVHIHMPYIQEGAQ
ncbi:MAG TPA: histidine kinase [Gallionellaceae bacterium]